MEWTSTKRSCIGSGPTNGLPDKKGRARDNRVRRGKRQEVMLTRVLSDNVGC